MAKSRSQKTQQKPAEHIIDEQTRKKVHAHLVNERDTISEKDISNVKTNFINESENNSIPPALEKATGQIKEEGLDEKQITDNTDPAIQTTWNILDEE